MTKYALRKYFIIFLTFLTYLTIFLHWFKHTRTSLADAGIWSTVTFSCESCKSFLGDTGFFNFFVTFRRITGKAVLALQSSSVDEPLSSVEDLLFKLAALSAFTDATGSAAAVPVETFVNFVFFLFLVILEKRNF